MVVLLIEDERKLTSVIKKSLEIEGYATDVAYDGEEGLLKGLKKDYDVILLDLMLPKKDGIEVCKELRRRQVQAPILILTARDKIEDRVRGLDSGADDYLVKPFDFDELLARMRSLQRRRRTVEPTKLVIADLELDPATHEVRRRGKLIELTHREYNLLDYLMRYPGQALTRNQLIEHVWGSGQSLEGNLLDVYIRYLRQKIDTDHERKLVQTVRGVGYKISG